MLGERSLLKSIRRTGSTHWVLLALVLLELGGLSAALAANPPNSPLVNPLEVTVPDPLIPQPERPLTPQEQQQLAIALDQLHQEAVAQLNQDNAEAAYELWHRELRLRRALRPVAEVVALGRVGGIAWEDNQTSEVRFITERLQTIQQTLQKQANQPTPELLQALGQSYRQVRARELAVGVYEQLLTNARQQKNANAEIETLATLGELHLNWFDYANAEKTYQALYPLLPAQSPSNSGLTQVEVLRRLVNIYEQSRQPAKAIAAQQQLITALETQQNLGAIPPVQLAIARNYETLNQIEPAIQSYEQSYRLAQPLQQFSYASEALQRLAALYQAQGQPDAALRTLQFLLDVEQQSYNTYGRMHAYDRIAQIHTARKDYPQAISALRQGLALAQQLNYRTDYFTQQIQQLSQSTP